MVSLARIRKTLSLPINRTSLIYWNIQEVFGVAAIIRTGFNIALRKRTKGLEKKYSKPWARFTSDKSKWHRQNKLTLRKIIKEDLE